MSVYFNCWGFFFFISKRENKAQNSEVIALLVYGLIGLISGSVHVFYCLHFLSISDRLLLVFAFKQAFSVRFLILCCPPGVMYGCMGMAHN